jgi:hypothetical protein
MLLFPFLILRFTFLSTTLMACPRFLLAPYCPPTWLVFSLTLYAQTLFLCLMGQSNEIFYLRFFTDGLLPSPLLDIKTFFAFGLEFEEIFAVFDWLSAIIYSGESILPILLNMESCDSPYHYSEESLFIRIICINSRLSFNTKSRYSLFFLMRRVTTPRIVYSGELFSQKFKDSPFL